MNVYAQELSTTLSQWTFTPQEGKRGEKRSERLFSIGETVERMCFKMCTKYGADVRVMLRISGRDFVTGKFRTVCSSPMRLESVIYDLIGRLVDDWHIKPKDAVFELTHL